MPKSVVLFGVLLLACTLVAADVARSADGTGFSEAAALSNAKAAANRKYRDKITSWGRQNCGMDGHQVDDNNVLRAFYRCTIDFTTRQ